MMLLMHQTLLFVYDPQVKALRERLEVLEGEKRLCRGNFGQDILYATHQRCAIFERHGL